jgi:hypothetical protein
MSIWVVFLCVSLGGLIMIWVIWYNLRRRTIIKESALAQGFTRVQHPSPEFQARIEALYRSSHGQRFKLRNVYQRSFADGDLYLFDLSETSGDGSTILVQMGIAVVSDQLALPWFTMRPKIKLSQKLTGLATRLIEATSFMYGQRIDFSDHPTFDGLYWVFSRDQDAVVDFLDCNLISFLAATPGYQLLAGGDTLVCSLPEYRYFRKQPGDLDMLQTNLKVSLKFYNQFKVASIKDKSIIIHLEDSALPSHCPACGGEWSDSRINDKDLSCRYCGHSLSISAPEPWKAAPSTRSYAAEDVKTPEFLNKMSTGSRILQSGCLLIFGIVWVLLSTFAIVLIAVEFYQDYKITQILSSEGVQTRATITNLTVDHDSEDGYTYYVSYQYQVPTKGDLAPYSGRQSVSSSIFATLEKGGKVDIVYAASQPSVSDIEANLQSNPLSKFISFLCFIGMGFLFLLVGLIVTIGGLIGYWRKNKQ